MSPRVPRRYWVAAVASAVVAVGLATRFFRVAPAAVESGSAPEAGVWQMPSLAVRSTAAGAIARVGPGVLVSAAGPAHSNLADRAAALPPSAADDDDDAAMYLAVASLSAAERGHLLDTMRYATARLEARLSPIGTDFEDDDPIDQFRAAMKPYVPSLNAARALHAGTWRASDFQVRAVARCEDEALADDEVCFPVSEGAVPASRSNRRGPNVDHMSIDAGRARFVAWPLTRAAVVEVDTAVDVDRLARALRTRVGKDGEPIALVLTAADLGMNTVVERDELQDAAKRLGMAMAASGIRDTDRLDALARRAHIERAARWLTLPTNTVMVVPRLSELARASRMSAAMETTAHDLGIRELRWLHRP